MKNHILIAVSLIFTLFSSSVFSNELIKAINNGSVEYASFYLGIGADPNARSAVIETPLAELIITNKNADKLFPLLLKYGADVNLPINRGEAGTACKTPLMLAIERKSLQWVKRLIKYGADVNIQVCDGFYLTPLMTAAKQNDNMAIIKYLIVSGADAAQPMRGYTNKRGHIEAYNAIDFATRAYKENIDAVKLFIKHGAAINDSAIFESSKKGYAEILALLLPLASKDYNLDEALYYALAGNHVKVVSLLKQYGAVFQKTYNDDIDVNKKWLLDQVFFIEFSGWNDRWIFQLRELHEFIKKRLISDSDNAFLWYLNGGMYVREMNWRGQKVIKQHKGIRIKDHRKVKLADSIHAKYASMANSAYEKALKLHTKVNLNQRLTRMMLLMVDSNDFISADTRVTALKFSLNSRLEHPYVIKRLKRDFNGFDEPFNYLHKFFVKGYYDEYVRMSNALVDEDRYDEAIDLLEKAMKLVPNRAAKYRERKAIYIRWKAKGKYN